MFLASIACSINSVESALKFEYMKIHREIANEILNTFTLGDFIKNSGEKLKEIKAYILLKRIILLNGIRVGFFHFNTNKLRKSASEILKVKFMNEESGWYTFLPTGGMKLKFLSASVYNISLDVLEKIYPRSNVRRTLSIVQKDWKEYRKRNPIK